MLMSMVMCVYRKKLMVDATRIIIDSANAIKQLIIYIIAVVKSTQKMCKHYLVYSYKLNKNTWGVKKVRGQEEPATKSSDIK